MSEQIICGTCQKLFHPFPSRLKIGGGKFCSVNCAAQSRRKHGYTVGKRSKAYYTWTGMKQRCLNKKSPSYALYGGRGISVCDRWVASFENFINDMGNPPLTSYSLDRIDTNGNYNKDNCRWTTQLVQENNRRDNVMLTVDGVTLTLRQWADITGINKGKLEKRFYRMKSFNKIISPCDLRRKE